MHTSSTQVGSQLFLKLHLTSNQSMHLRTVEIAYFLGLG